MVSLTCYGGVNEIGGNKILIETSSQKFWLDFGQSFNMGQEYFVNWLQPRKSNGLGDYFEFDLLPRLEGLYSKKALMSTSITHCEPEYDALFVTHAHFDHVNHINFLDPCIPIFLGKGTRLFMEAVEETSSFTNYGEHDYRGFRTGDKIHLDDIEVEPIHVDHSIPAAYGFIFHLPEISVVYTGDIRCHGPRSDMTHEFLRAASNNKPDVLICEGTRMTNKRKRKNFSEAQVAKGVKNVIKLADKTRKSVFYTHPSRDMDRLRTFFEAAKDLSRILVISPKTAHLLKRLIDDEHLDLPDPLDTSVISVYYRKKRSCTYSEKDYYLWERIFLDKIITSEELKNNPSNYLINLDFYNFAELIDIKPERGGYFIYSMSEPFTEEDLEDQVLHNWLKHFKLHYHQLHASGHMSKKELVNAINKVNPGKLIPIHTEEPTLFKKYFDNVVQPVLGESISI